MTEQIHALKKQIDTLKRGERKLVDQLRTIGIIPTQNLGPNRAKLTRRQRTIQEIFPLSEVEECEKNGWKKYSELPDNTVIMQKAIT